MAFLPNWQQTNRTITKRKPKELRKIKLNTKKKTTKKTDSKANLMRMQYNRK